MTAKTAHEVLIGVVALTVFVMFAVVLAGQNDNWGRGMAALFIAFLSLQIMFNASPFQKFLSLHPILTGQTNVTDNGNEAANAVGQGIGSVIGKSK